MPEDIFLFWRSYDSYADPYGRKGNGKPKKRNNLTNHLLIQQIVIFHAHSNISRTNAMFAQRNSHIQVLISFTSHPIMRNHRFNPCESQLN